MLLCVSLMEKNPDPQKKKPKKNPKKPKKTRKNPENPTSFIVIKCLLVGLQKHSRRDESCYNKAYDACRQQCMHQDRQKPCLPRPCEAYGTSISLSPISCSERVIFDSTYTKPEQSSRHFYQASIRTYLLETS